MQRLLLALLLVACSKKDEAKPAPSAITAPTTAPTPTPTKPTTPTAPTGTPKVTALGCDKVVPQALRDKHFKGATFKDETLADLQSGKCKVEGPVTQDMKNVGPQQKTWQGNVEVTCHENMPAGVMDSMLQRERSAPEHKPLTIGKGGAWIANGNNESAVAAFVYDNDSDCKVKTWLPKEIHKEEILSDLIANLPVK